MATQKGYTSEAIAAGEDGSGGAKGARTKLVKHYTFSMFNSCKRGWGSWGLSFFFGGEEVCGLTAARR